MSRGVRVNARQMEKARTRQRYLAEAARLFSEKGFHAVSIEALGAAVGMSGPALYRHFASKEDMLAEILVSTSERLLAGMEAIRKESDISDVDTLARLIDFHLDFALASREVIRLQDREPATSPAAINRHVRQLQRRYLAGWAELVSRVQQMPIEESRVLMHAVFGILNSTAHNADLAPGDATRNVLSAAA